MAPINLAIVGVGKIVRDQHLPAVAGDGDYKLIAAASRNGTVEGIDNFKSIEEMLAAVPAIDAVSLCMPPQYRYQAAEKALAAGKHVFLEKPPGATLSEVADLEARAAAKGLTLFASWHSRHAPAVEAAKAFLAGTTIRSMRVVWKEDVRHWHPNQDWIWQAGGLGVFDPGINALSILTEILPEPVRLLSAELDVPANRQAPIAARLQFSQAIAADFDFRQEGPQTWDIELQTDAGHLALRMGGNRLEIDGRHMQGADDIMGEYPALYAKMASLISERKSDADLAPMVLVADAFTLGRRNDVADFYF